MSVFEIYKQDGVKFMRPIHTREEYLSKRNRARCPTEEPSDSDELLVSAE